MVIVNCEPFALSVCYWINASQSVNQPELDILSGVTERGQLLIQGDIIFSSTKIWTQLRGFLRPDLK